MHLQSFVRRIGRIAPQIEIDATGARDIAQTTERGGQFRVQNSGGRQAVFE